MEVERYQHPDSPNAPKAGEEESNDCTVTKSSSARSSRSARSIRGIGTVSAIFSVDNLVPFKIEFEFCCTPLIFQNFCQSGTSVYNNFTDDY